MLTEAELPAKVRAFVALRLSPDVDEAILKFVAKLKKLGADAKWVNPGNLHLTLRFLGAAVDTTRLPPLKEALKAVAATTEPFQVTARGVGGFPSLKRPRVIWVGLEGAELPRLAERVEAVAVTHGFEPESRAYSPHLTVGRIRDWRGWTPVRRALEEAAELEFGTSRIDRMTLYRSILGPSGSTYEVLGDFPFGG